MGVFPVINCQQFKCVKEKVDLAKTFLPSGNFLHLDIADGTFTFHKTWNNPTEWANLRAPYELEIHLMVENPETYIDPWIAAGARRFIIHLETVTDDSLAAIFEHCDRRGVGVMLSLNPETPIEKTFPYLHYFLMVQVLAVHPGLAGQAFLPLTITRIQQLRHEWPHGIIEVDGGMNPKTARMVKEAGANFIVSSNYIFGNKHPADAYDELITI
jgi:ribulose-phosphate 3-epimerase